MTDNDNSGSRTADAFVVAWFVTMGAGLVLAADLVYVAYLGAPWSAAYVLAGVVGVVVWASAITFAIALVSRYDAVGGVPASAALTARISALARARGVAPPDRVLLVAEPRVDLLHCGRPWSCEAALVLGATVVATSAPAEVDSLVVRALVRYGGRTRLTSLGRSVVDIVGPVGPRTRSAGCSSPSSWCSYTWSAGRWPRWRRASSTR